MCAQHVVVVTDSLSRVAELLLHFVDNGEYCKGELHYNNHWRVYSSDWMQSEPGAHKSNCTTQSPTSGPLGLQVEDRYTLQLEIMPPKSDPEPSAEQNRPPQSPQAPRYNERGERDKGPEGTENNQEAMLEQRLTRLIETLNKDMHNSNLKNVSFEIGRPSLEPTASMKRNPANPYGRFSIDELFKMKVNIVSNNMATTEQMAKITADIAGLGVPTEYIAAVILQMVIMCASVSSSAFLDPDGSIEFDTGAVPVDSIAAIMKKHAGLRKVCRLYAPIVWNSMLVRNQPPADWQAMGFPFNARFAAFDTFDYVTNPAAIQPVEGIIRRPTSEEVIAHNAHKRMALDRANRNEKFGNLETEYTGGIQGAEIVRNHRNANNG